LERAHGLCGGIEVSEHHVRLPAHLHCLHSHDIEYHAISRKQHVQIALQIFLGELVIEASYIQTGCR
jgi:hypothetical protein